jgi:hypothetical protein
MPSMSIIPELLNENVRSEPPSSRPRAWYAHDSVLFHSDEMFLMI